MVFPTSKLSQENVLRDVHDPVAQALRTTAQATIVVPGGLEVNIDSSEDSIAIGDQSSGNLLTINPDGSINVLLPVATTPGINNLNLVNNANKYSFVFPVGTKKFTIKSRNTGVLQVSLDSSPSSAYVTVGAGSYYQEENISTNFTVFIKSSKNNDIAEIVYWT